MENIENKINKIITDITNMVNNEKNVKSHINEIESKLTQIQNFYLRPNVTTIEQSNYNKAFDNFIKKGVSNDLIKKSLSSDKDSAGVTITSSLQQKIIANTIEKSPFRQIASIDTISSNSLDLLIENNQCYSGWVGEDENRLETMTPQLTKKTIHVHELYAQPKATQRLINDSEINIEQWLAEKLSESFAQSEHEAFIKGDGNKKPFGLLNNSKIPHIDAGNTITTDILLKLINSLPEKFIPNATFLMNRNTLSIIQGLKDKLDRFIWQPSLSDPLKHTILGIPVQCSSYMPDIGKNNCSISLGDFKAGYKIVDRSNIQIMRDPYTEKPFVKFYATKRVGADVIDHNAILFAKFS